MMSKRELQSQLQLADSVLWTDSTAVLKNINNETTRFRTFVANRVSEILTVSIVATDDRQDAMEQLIEHYFPWTPRFIARRSQVMELRSEPTTIEKLVVSI